MTSQKQVKDPQEERDIINEIMARKLDIKYKIISQMSVDALRSSLKVCVDFGSQKDIGNSELFSSVALSIYLMDDLQITYEMQKHLYNLSERCMISKVSHIIAIGIELQCNLLTSKPRLRDVLRTKILNGLNDEIISGPLEGSANDAICGLMLIAKELSSEELTKYVKLIKKRIKKGYRNPVVLEFMADLNILDRIRKTYPEWKIKSTPKDCHFVGGFSRKGGTGKTSVLLGTLLSLAERLDDLDADDKAQICVIDFDSSGPSWPFLFPIYVGKEIKTTRRAVFLNHYFDNEKATINEDYFNKIFMKYEDSKRERKLRFDAVFLNPLHGKLNEINNQFDMMKTSFLEKVTSIFKWAGEQYRYVLVDCPPGLYEAAKYILHVSFKMENWHRFMVSGPQLADIAGIATEMDTHLLDINGKGKDMWLINQVPTKKSIIGAYADVNSMEGRNDLPKNFQKGFLLLDYLPLQPSLWKKLSRSYLERPNTSNYILPFDIALREHCWTLRVKHNKVVANESPMSIHQLRVSDFYSILEKILSKDFNNVGNK